MPVPAEIAVRPVVAILPLLPATGGLLVILLVSLLGLITAALRLRTGSLRHTGQVLWRQSPGLAVLLLILAAVRVATSYPTAGWSSGVSASGPPPAGSWPMFRGSPTRSGHADEHPGPISGPIHWWGGRGWQFYSSPAVVGGSIIAIGNQGDAGRIFCWDADTGRLQWTIAPPRYRATLASPVVESGYLVIGEGLHQTTDARVMIWRLNANGPPHFVDAISTQGHVECTPVLADGSIYFNAGDDGVYCVDGTLPAAPELHRRWHGEGSAYPDAETALAVHEDRVYVGLGFGGEALCMLDARTGRELKRAAMPLPVFAPPAISGDHVYLGLGRASFVSSDSSPGEVRCVHRETLATLWSLPTPSSVLAAPVVHEDEVVFGTVDGQLFVVDRQGRPRRRWRAEARMLAAPAVTEQTIYCVTCDGMLTALDRNLQRIWTARIGMPGNYISSPVVFRGRIYVGTPEDGFVCVGDPPQAGFTSGWPGTDGGPGHAGTFPLEPIPSPVREAWHLPGPRPGVPGRVTAPPAVTPQDLLVPMSSRDGQAVVRMAKGEDGSWNRSWVRNCRSPVVTSPAAIKDWFFYIEGAAGRDGTLYSIERYAGREYWSYPLVTVDHTLVATEDTLFLVDPPGTLLHLDLWGEEEWRVEAGIAEWPVHAVGPWVAALGQDPFRLLLLDRPTGSILWQVPLTAAPVDSPVIRADAVVLATTAGIEVRSLVDGSLSNISAGWSPSAVNVIGHEHLFGLSADDELLVGSWKANRFDRRTLGERARLHPLIGSNGLVFAADPRHLRWQPFSANGIEGESQDWYACGAQERFEIPPVMRDGRIYVGIAGRGLVCLERPLSE